MLLAGLQRQAIGFAPMAVDRHPHNAPRHGPFIGFFAGHIGRVRTAIANRHAKALRAANGDISIHGAGLFQQRQRQRIRADYSDGFCRMQIGNRLREIMHMPIGARILKNRAKYPIRNHPFRRIYNHLNPQRFRAGLHHGYILRMAIFIHEKRFGF